MKVKDILIVLRKEGFFHFGERRIQAARPGEGYGVMVLFETSQADFDFEGYVWFPSQDELDRIQRSLSKSDELTHNLLGRGWSGKRPFYRLEDFM